VLSGAEEVRRNNLLEDTVAYGREKEYPDNCMVNEKRMTRRFSEG
jgi:hypothetical protein